ncbi:MAG: hypothetical protein LIO79_05415 [Rikenellaceae bacterium]|nr:hypothetical protein [Rikenellaceae bacterium]
MTIKLYIRLFCVGFLTLAATASCTKDTTVTDSAKGTDEAWVKLSIHTPSSSVPKGTKSEAMAEESAVERIKLVVLQLSGSQYRYRYMVDGQQIIQSSSDSQTTNFNALLTSSDVPLKILLAANYNDAFDSDSFAEDMTEDAVKRLLVDSFESNIEGKLPLYGEIDLPYLKADQSNNFAVTMLRAVARVDVINAITTDTSGDFRLKSVHIYRANDQYAIVPDDSAMQTEGKMTVSSASVPSTATTYAPYMKTVAADGDISLLQTYLPESLPVADENARTATATCVVVGGYYGDDTYPSYYRVDFNSGYDGHPFGQVLRNHKYIFNIVQVNGSGWTDPDEAANNEATAIIATMQIWDELTSEMWFYGNENYLGISSRRVVLNYFTGSEKTEILQATVPFSIQPLDEYGNPTGTAIKTDGESFSAGFYTLELKKDGTDGEDVWRLVITSTGDNYTNAEYTGSFQVYTDWWTFDVEVIQETYVSQRADRYVKILTITDLDGDLGTTDGTFTELSGSAMRNVLENTANFGPQGIVTIGGIIVYDLKNATISSESASDMYILEKVLSDVDVVHLPGLCSPSVTAAEFIEAWHRAKPNRVLIIGLDDENTNTNLRSYIYDLEEVDPDDPSSGTWEVNTTVKSLTRGYDDMGTDRFFYGVFGDVKNGDMGLSKFTHIGYNNGYNWETTISLLMIGQADDNKNMMTHGLNTGSGIFYCGDSGITSDRNSAMSSQAAATGTVTSDFDRLMGNIWDWIVERVTMVSENE